MISEPTPGPAPTAAPPGAALPAIETFPTPGSHWLLGGVAVVAILGVVASGLLWQKVSSMQEHLARQSADATAQAVEARAMARTASELSRETAARLSVNDTRLGEVALQRSQLEDLMQSLSRSRDENLVVDIESALRLAQQQATLTSSTEPLLAALQTAAQRVERSAQPRLAPLQRAIERDIERVTSASITDVAGLLARLDDLIRTVDALPTLNAVAPASTSSRFTTSGADKVRPTAAARPAGSAGAAGTAAEPAPPGWLRSNVQRVWDGVWDEARGLLRVSRIDQPDAALVSPEQTFFLRENLKHKLVSARLGILARQIESARADLTAANMALNKYFDPTSRRVQSAATLMQQITAQTRSADLPRIDETLSALATAAAGR